MDLTWRERTFPRLDWRGWVVMGAAGATALVLALVDRFEQPAWFHDFADRRTMLGVANFMDVASNAPFAAASVWGLACVWARRRSEKRCVAGGCTPMLGIDVVCAICFFVGVGLTSLGSGWYHLNPRNETLVWDRLPLILTFVSLLGMLMAERVSSRSAGRLLGPMLAIGACAVGHWAWTESRGAGDLRAYFAVQIATLVSVVLIVALYPSRYLSTRLLATGLVCYGLAVAFEQLDKPVWNLWRGLGVELVSGHTIKHLFAAGGAFVMILAIKPRAELRVAGKF